MSDRDNRNVDVNTKAQSPMRALPYYQHSMRFCIIELKTADVFTYTMAIVLRVLNASRILNLFRLLGFLCVFDMFQISQDH